MKTSEQIELLYWVAQDAWDLLGKINAVSGARFKQQTKQLRELLAQTVNEAEVSRTALGALENETVPRSYRSRQTNPAPRIGPAKPKRASQRAHVTKPGIESKTPSKRLIKRRTANTKKGYFPNPKERIFNVWHKGGYSVALPLLGSFDYSYQGDFYRFALHPELEKPAYYSVSEWKSGALMGSFKVPKNGNALQYAKDEVTFRLGRYTTPARFREMVARLIAEHGGELN